VLTDNGIQLTNHERHVYAFEHIFDRVCHAHQIEHQLTKIRHPWTNGQAERMNRTLPVVPASALRSLIGMAAALSA
jgi:transposase InsO family protein